MNAVQAEKANKRTEQIQKIAKIIKRIKKGDKKSLHILYDNTWEPVYYMLLKKTGQEEESRILLHEVYVKVFENVAKLKDDKLFYAWLTKIVFAVCADFFREKQKRSVEEFQNNLEFLQEEDEEFLPGFALEKKEVRTVVIQSINELPETQRETIFMFYYQNLTVQNIAEATGSSENTVYKRLHDAKKSLKTKLAPYMAPGFSALGFDSLGSIWQEDITSLAGNAMGEAVWKSLASTLAANPAIFPVAAGVTLKAAIAGGAVVAVSLTAVIYPYISETKFVSENPQIYVSESIESPLWETAETPIIVAPSPTAIPFQLTQAVDVSPLESQPWSPENTARENTVRENTVQEAAQPEHENPREIETQERTNHQPESESRIFEAQTPQPRTLSQINSLLFLPYGKLPQDFADIKPDEPPQQEVAERDNSSSSKTTSRKIDTPDTAKVNRIYLKSPLVYEINDGPDEPGLIDDISAGSENVFDPRRDEVTVISNNFRGNKVGSYHVELRVKLLSTGDIAKIASDIQVIGAPLPVVTVEKYVVALAKDRVVSLDEILKAAGVSAEDSAGRPLNPIVTGYEEMDFSREQEYVLQITAKDFRGQEAHSRNIIVIIGGVD